MVEGEGVLAGYFVSGGVVVSKFAEGVTGFAHTTTTKKGRKTRKAKWLAYMLVNCEENLSAKKVKENYRKRFVSKSASRNP